MIRDHAFFVHPASADGGEPTGVSLQARVSELEDEVSRLREQLGKAKGVNDAMWDSVVQRLVAEAKEKENQTQSKEPERSNVESGRESMQDSEPVPGERRRKRGRT